MSNPSFPALKFVGRLIFFWAAAVAAVGGVTLIIFGHAMPKLGAFVGTLLMITVAMATIFGYTHVRRIQLIAGRIDETVLGARHRHRIEVPFVGEEAFEIVEASIRELPRLRRVDADRVTLTVKATIIPINPYDSTGMRTDGLAVNRVEARIGTAGDCCSVALVCEPARHPWWDWFFIDDGSNFENAEVVTRAITRRVAERRAVEQADTQRANAEKELADAKLALLQAQVEPHFLYNTLANAQLLTRSDPARADQMLGELITYLRCSLPREGQGTATLGEELERVSAYLALMKIRMGERLKVDIHVDEALHHASLPSMVLQTLVENAIKHGLEPRPGRGTLWISAQQTPGAIEIRVADDGCGFGHATQGSGIGLKNARERLRLAFGDRAALHLGPNYPSGVTATLTIPFAAKTA